MFNEIDLADLEANNGFTINGISRYDESGFFCQWSGDINGDGIDDFIMAHVMPTPTAMTLPERATWCLGAPAALAPL